MKRYVCICIYVVLILFLTCLQAIMVDSLKACPSIHEAGYEASQSCRTEQLLVWEMIAHTTSRSPLSGILFSVIDVFLCLLDLCQSPNGHG